MKAPGDAKSMGPNTARQSTESDHRPTAKHGKLWSPAPKNPKTAESKPKHSKTKAPATSKSTNPVPAGPPAWSDDAITIAYHRRKLDTLLASDPVAKLLEIQLLGELGGPVSPIPQLQTVTEAVTALVTLLREENMVAGQFVPNTLIDLGLNSITSLLNKLHKRLAILVGTTTRPINVPLTPPMTTPSRDSQMTLQDFEAPPQVRPQPDIPILRRRHQPPLPPSICDAEQRSSCGSSVPDQCDRMPLGPAGAAMLQARARGGVDYQGIQETTTRVHPKDIQSPDRVKFCPIGMRHRENINFSPPRDEDAGGMRLPTR